MILHILQDCYRNLPGIKRKTETKGGADSPVRDDDYLSMSPISPRTEGSHEGQKTCGKDHWLGELLHNPELQNRQEQGEGWCYENELTLNQEPQRL